MMKVRLVLLAVAALILSSCVSNIGGVIRDGAVEQVAVDTGRPVGGVVYQNRKYASEVMQAPEVVYHGRDGMLYDVFVHDCYLCCPEVKDTGRQLWVRKSPDGEYSLLEEPPSADWKPVLLKNTPTVPTRAYRLKPYATRVVGSKALRSVLAAPFDYVIDPLLTVGVNATLLAGELLVFPFQMLYSAVDGAGFHHSPAEAEAM